MPKKIKKIKKLQNKITNKTLFIKIKIIKIKKNKMNKWFNSNKKSNKKNNTNKLLKIFKIKIINKGLLTNMLLALNKTPILFKKKNLNFFKQNKFSPSFVIKWAKSKKNYVKNKKIFNQIWFPKILFKTKIKWFSQNENKIIKKINPLRNFLKKIHLFFYKKFYKKTKINIIFKLKWEQFSFILKKLPFVRRKTKTKKYIKSIFSKKFKNKLIKNRIGINKSFIKFTKFYFLVKRRLSLIFLKKK